MVRFQRERLVEACQGVVELALLLKRDGKIGKIGGIACIPLHCLADQLGGGGRASRLDGENAEEMQRIWLTRFKIKRQPIMLFRFLQLPGAVVPHACRDKLDGPGLLRGRSALAISESRTSKSRVFKSRISKFCRGAALLTVHGRLQRR